MTDPAPTRRSFLSYATSGGVAVGALVSGGALMRSCSPVDARTTRIDLSDMEDGEIRLYSGSAPMIILRDGPNLRVFDARCPVSSPWVLTYLDHEDRFFCTHCTSRFSRDGKITQYWGNRNPSINAPDLRPIDIATDGQALIIGEDQLMPRQSWSSL